MNDDEDSGNDRTPVRGAPPEYLPPSEVRRIEHVMQRQPGGAHMALAERIRAEGADLYGLVAQNALDVHDMGKHVADLGKPIKTISKLAWMAIAGSFTAIGFVAWVVATYVGNSTAVEFRLQRCERVIVRFENPGFPVASTPAPSMSTPKGLEP